MPVAIGAALAAEVLGSTIASTTIIGTVTVGTAVGYGIASAITLGASFALAGLQEKAKSAPEQLTVRQPIPMRWRGHGTAKLGGALFYLQTPSGVLISGRVCCVGPVTTFREFWLNDIKTSLPPGLGGVIPDPVYKRTAIIDVRAGTEDQTASGLLLRGAGWDETCQLKGLAYTVGLFGPTKFGRLIYPSGEPNVRVVADLVPVYDPRDGAQSPGNPGTWRWSDNAALVLLDYLNHESGYGIPFDEIALDTFVALANVSDEMVPLRVPAADGSTAERRYRSWGGYDYGEQRADVLARYLAACDGELYEDADGRVAVRGGRWEEPTFTITPDMILGWDSVEVGDEAFATVNQIKFSYTSVPHGHQPTEGDPWDDEDSQDRVGILPTERDFRRSPSHSQARRLAKIALRKATPLYRITGLRLSPKGLPAFGRGMVRLRLPLFGIDTTFAISRGQLTGATLTDPVFDLYSLTSGAYSWNPNLEEGNAPPAPDTTPTTNIPVPVNPTVTIQRTVVGSNVTSLGALFGADPVDGRSDLTLIGQYRRVGDVDWVEMASQAGQPIAQPIDEGIEHEAELAWRSGTAIGDFGEPITFTAVADETSPGPAAEFGAEGDEGETTYHVVMPNTANAARAVIYRNTTNNLRTAKAVHTHIASANVRIDGTDTVSAGTFFYWVRILNGSGYPALPTSPTAPDPDPSTTSGPIQVTVT